MNSINPEDYLRCLFDAAPYCVTESDFEQLLPWNIEIKPYVPQGTWMGLSNGRKLALTKGLD